MITRVVAFSNCLLVCLHVSDFFICLPLINLLFDLRNSNIKTPVCQRQFRLGTGFQVARAFSAYCKPYRFSNTPVSKKSTTSFYFNSKVTIYMITPVTVAAATATTTISYHAAHVKCIRLWSPVLRLPVD